jgi:hypothetical protein
MARQTFGQDHVFANATVKRSNGDIDGEADVLVVSGEFVLVIQAKSKQLTLEVRSDGTEKLKTDFQAVIQSAYDHAVKFVDSIVAGRECEVDAKDRRSFKMAEPGAVHWSGARSVPSPGPVARGFSDKVPMIGTLRASLTTPGRAARTVALRSRSRRGTAPPEAASPGANLA